jgi:AcrR family transcriptional regulator
MSTDRKTTIADAALALLASSGSRGLTHRAVDALAGLPEGSTSSCCRSRLDLLTLALHRHATRNLEDLQADAERLAQAPPSLSSFIDALVDRIDDWTSPDKRPRVVASREPSLQAVVADLHQRFVGATTAALNRLGMADPDTMAAGLIATVDGILLGQVVNGGTRPDRQACRAILMRAVSGP